MTAKGRLRRFRCVDCGLQLAVEEPPENCFCCGSTRIVREGWRQRFRILQVNDYSKEKMTR